MDNRARFYEWLKKEKNYSPRELRYKRMEYESLGRRYPLFEISDAEQVNNLGIKKEKDLIDVYSEFLTLNNGKSEKKDLKYTAPALFENVEHKNTPSDKETIDKAVEYEAADETLKLKEYGFVDFANECEQAEKAILTENNLSKRECVAAKKKQQPVFDIVNGRFYDLNNNVNFLPMATYAFYKDEEGTQNKFKRRDNVFYYDSSCIPKQISVAAAYKSESNVIKTSLDETYQELAEQSQNIDEKPICIVPDTAGDFNDVVKSQIKSSNYKFVQVPRSVAAVYSCVDIEQTKTENEYTVFDFDAERLTKTIIRVEYDEDNEVYNIVRYARRTFSSDDIAGFSSVAEIYIKEYLKKKHIVTDEEIIKNLISSRDIYNIICKKQNILIKDKGNYLSLKYDEGIMSVITDCIRKVVSKSGESNPLVIFGIQSNIEGFIAADDLAIGYRRILNRIINGKIIYKEYLPELSLEVIRNGTFDTLQLISRNNVQNITESSMDEEVDIPIENGRFVFMPGREKIYCPLTREEFGNMQRDKLAMFCEPKIFPLKNVVEVELSLKYRYGDPDSYRLIATPINGEFPEISSQWCDENDRKMGNDKIPEYTPQRTPNKNVDINKIIEDTLSKTKSGWCYRNRNDNLPFDKFNNWRALTPVIYNLIEMKNVFSTHSADDNTINNVIRLFEKLDELYRDADCGCLYEGMCELDPFHIGLIKNNILNITSTLGMITLNDFGLDYSTRCSVINSILESNNHRCILQLSESVSREHDEFHVWDKADKLFLKLKGNQTVNLLRTIGTVCWRNENWIYEFSEIDKRIMQSIIDTAIAVCHNEIDNIKNGYNPRKIRDVLEALLGIVRLKKENTTVFKLMNCNSPKIKNFIVDLKSINKLMQECKPEYPFVSRLGMEVPDNMRNVSSVVYPLIEILSDGNAVKLTGFTED